MSRTGKMGGTGGGGGGGGEGRFGGHVTADEANAALRAKHGGGYGKRGSYGPVDAGGASKVVPVETPYGGAPATPAPTGPGAGGGGGGGDLTFATELDPRLTKHTERIDERLDDPMGSTGRAIDMATSRIRDATEGRRSAVRGMLAKTGGLGATSAGAFAERQLNTEEGQQVANAAANIALGRERDNDAFMLGATGALAAPGEASRAERALGLSAWQAAQANERARERSAMDDWIRKLDVIGSMGGGWF